MGKMAAIVPLVAEFETKKVHNITLRTPPEDCATKDFHFWHFDFFAHTGAVPHLNGTCPKLM